MSRPSSESEARCRKSARRTGTRHLSGADNPTTRITADAVAQLRGHGNIPQGNVGTLSHRELAAIIETESNFLLNPEHGDFAKIEIREPIPFSLDLRLLRH